MATSVQDLCRTHEDHSWRDGPHSSGALVGRHSAFGLKMRVVSEREVGYCSIDGNLPERVNTICFGRGRRYNKTRVTPLVLNLQLCHLLMAGRTPSSNEDIRVHSVAKPCPWKLSNLFTLTCPRNEFKTISNCQGVRMSDENIMISLEN